MLAVSRPGRPSRATHSTGGVSGAFYVAVAPTSYVVHY